MPENIYSMVDPEVLKKGAIEELEKVSQEFSNNAIDTIDLFGRARNVWENMNKNPVLNEKINDEIRRRRLAVHQITSVDISNGDPILKRYDPNEWLGNIPPEFIDKNDIYIQDKVKSLLNLIKGI